MGKTEKLLEKLARCDGNFSFREAETLLGQLGYERSDRGATSGSVVLFYNREKDALFRLHRPHPEKTLGVGVCKKLTHFLKENGDYV